MAPARKVSPAASSTSCPLVWSRCASLAMEVVLPAPFTPTTNTTCGGGPLANCACRPPSASVSRAASSARAASGSDAPSARTVSRSSSSNSIASMGPRSAAISNSSSSSQSASFSSDRRSQCRTVANRRRVGCTAGGGSASASGASVRRARRRRFNSTTASALVDRVESMATVPNRKVGSQSRPPSATWNRPKLYALTRRH